MANQVVDLSELIDLLPEPVVVIDRDYTVTYINRAGRQLTGLRNASPESVRCYQVFHHGDEPCGGEDHPCPVPMVVQTRSPVTVEHTHCDAHGNEVVTEILAGPVFDETGRVAQVVQAWRDVTARSRAARAGASQPEVVAAQQVSDGNGNGR